MAQSDPTVPSTRLAGDTADKVATLREDQRQQWAQGRRPVVEDYLALEPALAQNAEAILELICQEMVLREQHNDPPHREDYQRRFPGLARELAIQFELHEAVRDKVLPGLEGRLEAEPAAPELPGLEILGVLGQGGMGVVYKARQQTLGRVVAVKMIRGVDAGTPQERRRFRAEAEAVARLQHPNIVQIHEVGETSGRPYLVLEHLEGGSLSRKLAGGPLPGRAAAQLLLTIAGAVAAAHARGIVHRDLKPPNILLTADGQPKIVDFGLASAPDRQSLTQTGEMVGTPSYMAPEQALGNSQAVGPPADIYALGAILYEMLTCQPPFRGPTALSTLEMVRSCEPVPPRRMQPGVERDLETICLCCLRKEPGKRYPSAQALAEDLQSFLAREPIKARAPGSAERVWKWARRRPAVAILLAALAVVVVAAFATVTVLWLQTAAALDDTERARAAEAAEHEQALAHLYDRQILLARLQWENRQFDQAKATLKECEPARRDRNWRYLHRVLHGQLWQRPQEKEVHQVTFDASGQRLAVASSGGVTVFNAQSGEQLWFRAGRFLQAVFHPEKNRLVAFGHWGLLNKEVKIQNSLTVCDLTRDEVIASRPWDPHNPFHPYLSQAGVQYVAMEQSVVTNQFQNNLYKVSFKDPIDGELLQEAGPVRAFCRAAFSRDGRRFAGLDYPLEKIWIWDVFSGAQVRAIRLEKSLIHPIQAGEVRLAVSSDGAHVALGYLPNKVGGEAFHGLVKVFEVANGAEKITFQAHANFKVNDLAFCPLGRRLATVSEDRTMVIWDWRAGKELLTFRMDSKSIRPLSFSPDGRRLAAGDSAALPSATVGMWDVSPLEEEAVGSTTAESARQ
jgi:WD40 repeat protein